MIAKSKRSISSVVATILLILIAILAILLFWFLLRGFLRKSSSGIETSCLTLDLEIRKAQINTSSDILHVNIKRNSGAGNLSGIRFKITNSSESVLRDKDTNMRELETEIFSFDDIGNVSYIKRVDIAGIVSLGGEVKICRIADSSKVFERYGISYTPPIPECEEDSDCEEGQICVDEVCIPSPPEIYVPNQTGNNAWYGGHISAPVTLGAFKDTVYTSAELDRISIEDSDYVEVAASGTSTYSCQGKTETADCTPLSELQCPNYYETGEMFCEWMGGEACVATTQCFQFPGHELEFKITEDRSSINNISIRVVSFGAIYWGNGGPRLLAIYNWTKNSYIQFDTDNCMDGPANVRCNLTAFIADPINFVNSSGSLDVILYDSTAAPDYSIRNY
jgi:hypothetical protein